MEESPESVPSGVGRSPGERYGMWDGYVLYVFAGFHQNYLVLMASVVIPFIFCVPAAKCKQPVLIFFTKAVCGTSQQLDIMNN